MPRPKEGYRNLSGIPIPGTHDPISRFKDPGGLYWWHYTLGRDGKPFPRRGQSSPDIDIGHVIHGMAELDLRGRQDREIEAFAHDRLAAPDHLRKAFASFNQFRQWRQQCHVRAIAQECTLVSEKWQYGGTPDTIAMIDNRVALIDFKSMNKPNVYPEHLLALAAYGNLWEENHPSHTLNGGYHLIILPKDGSEFQHHAYDDLELHWRLFQLYLDAYRIEKSGELPKANGAHKVTLKREEVMPIDAGRVQTADTNTVVAPPQPPIPLAAGAEKKAAAPSAPRRTPRPKTVMPAPKAILNAPRSLSMAELLRSYGHISAL